MPGIERARVRNCGALAATAVLVALWLLTITHHGFPRRLNQAALAAAMAFGLWWLFHLVTRIWRGELLDRTASRWLLFATGAALVLQAIGLGHEIGGRYFGDEGWFLAEAQRINSERPLRPWFVYPHFLFYWDALALWIADLCGPVVPALARRIWGVEGELYVAALVTRVASSTLAALATVPAFLAARRLMLAPGETRDADGAGARAGLCTALLLALSPTMVEIGRLNLADVPSAFWSACAAYGVALLIERETTRRYLLTGAAAGLAAVSKYPAGVVAVAIAAVWMRGVVSRRRLNPGLLWAAAAAIAAFLLLMPSLFRFPEVAFVTGEGRPDIFYGVRQYSGAQWYGVVRASNSLYYLRELAHAFGWPALALGAAGVVTLPAACRRRVAWMLPFPIFHLALLLAMALAVRRNLMPLLPFLAVILGSGLAGLYDWCATRWRRRVAAATVAAALLLPAAMTALLLVRQSVPTTRDTAAAWMREHLPPGSFLVQEQYTPLVGPEELFPARRPRFAGRLETAVLRDPRHDYLLLSSEAYSRFLEPSNLEDFANHATAARYREIFATWPLVREWSPGRLQAGPVLRLYRVDSVSPDFPDSTRLLARDALASDPAMKTADGGVLAFTRPGQWVLFKVDLARGIYRLRVEDPGADGRLRVRMREQDDEETFALAAGEARVDVPRPGRVFLYLELPPGASVRELAIHRD